MANIKNGKKNGANLYAIIIGTILVLYTISLFVPLLWGIMTSLKEQFDWGRPGTYLAFPDMSYWQTNAEMNAEYIALGLEPPFANYDNLFGNYLRLFTHLQIEAERSYYIGPNLDIFVNRKETFGILGLTMNTLLYAGGTALCGAMAPCIAGYLCSKFKYKFSGIIYSFVLFTMVMPIVGTTTAKLTLLRQIGIYDTIYGMWIMSFSFSSTNFLIFYALFSGVSDTYSEAAQIDGASYFRIMWTIYMPLAIKTISTIFVLAFVLHYNDYNSALLWIPSHPTLAYAVWFFSKGGDSKNDNVPFNLAAAMALAMPMVIFFAIFKKKLMGDVSLGGIKE